MKNKQHTNYLIVIFIGLAFLFTNSLWAQRPKVGLVLSGGGAKGISHIGILQAIDSAGLKIDYITGTSMGSIVGALYAVGYSGTEIEKISNELDWDIILSNKPNYRDISIEEKDEYGKYAVELGFKNGKPQIATGLIESEELWLTLNRLFLPVYNIKDFSKFNIPFKCVATDLANGDAVVFDKGEIVNALRASMAIPSVFTAVDYDSTKLVDGGIIRNFPVIDAKEMGADIIIGVNLFLGLPKVDKLNNVLDVFYQITQYRDAEDLITEKKLCNLIIEPPVEEYSAGSFSDIADIMRIGKEIGEKYYPYFKHLADSLNTIEQVAFNPNNRLPEHKSIIIDTITFEGLEKTSSNFLLDKIQISTGKSYTASDINKGFRKAYSSRYYNKVYYRLTPTEKGHAALHCIVSETEMTQVKFGVSYHSYTGIGLIGNITLRNLLLDKSRTFIKFAISDYLRFQFEHNQAFGRKGTRYINLKFSSEKLPLYLYDGNQKSSVYDATLTQFDLNFKQTIGNDWSLATGTHFLKNSFSPDVVGELRYKGNSNNYYSYFNAQSLTTDRVNFPTSGHDFFAETGIVYHRKANIERYTSNGTSTDVSDLVNNQAPFVKMILTYSKYLPVNSKLVFMYNLQTGLSIQSQGFIFDNYYLGGVQKLEKNQMPFAGINETQITSSSMGSAMIGLQYNFLDNFMLIGRVNTGLYNFSTEDNFYDSEKVKILNGFSLGLGYNLGIMPTEFTAMYSPEIDALYLHVRIGILF